MKSFKNLKLVRRTFYEKEKSQNQNPTSVASEMYHSMTIRLWLDQKSNRTKMTYVVSMITIILPWLDIE